MRLHTLVLVLLLGWTPLLAACGGPSEFAVVGTPRAAGTDGMVTVEEIEGGNYLVLVEVQHLPPPDRIAEDASTYIVWFKPEDGSAAKAGRLAYDPDERTGTMRATTPAGGNFTVIITAESEDTASAPADTVVVQREVSM